MAFSPNSLRRVAQTPIGLAAGTVRTGQISRFLYATDDLGAVVEAAGYFNGARALLRPGDQIDATVAAAAATPVMKNYVVLTVPATGNVTIGLQTTTAG